MPIDRDTMSGGSHMVEGSTPSSTGTPRVPQNVARVTAESDFRRRPSPIDQFESYWFHAVTFILMVVLPVLGVSLYYYLWASDQYAAEVRFSVRRAQDPIIGDDALSMLAKGFAVSTVGREPYMVASYVRSQNIVEELDKLGWLRSLYSKPNADFFARVDPKASGRRLWKYWQKMVSASVDRVSGLVTVRVLAFSPEDALMIVRAVRLSAERMIDRSFLRARTDELRLAEEDLSRARQRNTDALLALRQIRENEQTVDPEKTISATASTLIGAIREKLALERDRDVDLKVLSRSAPQLQILNQRLQALDEQVAALRRSLTSQTGDERTAADSISHFDKRELERRFSEKLLEISEESYERARLQAERQHLYLATFVEPFKPDEAEYPKRLRTVALASICTAAGWGVTLLLVAAVQDHKLIS
jgi:capsular polysaccharide transport system permease protein